MMNKENGLHLDYSKLPDYTLIDSNQAADFLHIKPGTLQAWRTTGKYGPPYRKIGIKVFYTAGDIKSWMNERVQIHTGENK